MKDWETVQNRDPCYTTPHRVRWLTPQGERQARSWLVIVWRSTESAEFPNAAPSGEQYAYRALQPAIGMLGRFGISMGVIGRQALPLAPTSWRYHRKIKPGFTPRGRALTRNGLSGVSDI